MPRPQRTVPSVTVAIRSDNVIQLLSGHTVATALPPAFLQDLRRWLTLAFASWPPHLWRYEVTMAQIML